MGEFIRFKPIPAALKRILTCLPFALHFFSGGCNESLPPYRDPEHVFRSEIKPEYMFYRTGNFLDVQLYVVNIFDETFSAPSLIQGSVEISLHKNPEYTRVFTLTPSDIRFGKYISSTGILTMDPGDTLKLGIQWNFIDAAGRDLRQEVFQFVADPDCPARMIAQPETFMIKGDLKIYERTATIELGPILYSICYIDRWIDPRSCITITSAEACSKIR
jgi:hypothetical protein